MRRLAELATELAAEVRARKAGGACHVIDVERLEVAGVGEVLGAQEMPGGRGEHHPRQYRSGGVQGRRVGGLPPAVAVPPANVNSGW